MVQFAFWPKREIEKGVARYVAARFRCEMDGIARLRDRSRPIRVRLEAVGKHWLVEEVVQH